jgi:hypothetical protein
MSDIDTTTAAILAHLDIGDNHEAGLIPMATQVRLLALAAERDKLAAMLAEAVEVLRNVDDKISWEINPSNYSHEEVCDMNADWCEIGNYVTTHLSRFAEPTITEETP